MSERSNKACLVLTERDTEIQREYAAKVAELLFSRGLSSPNAFVRTYGCQQNVSDSERIKGLLAMAGYGITDSLDQADLVLYNTCAVREHAEDRVYGNVGKLKEYKNGRPGAIIALCGCMMQQEHVAARIKKSFPHVDLVFGTHVIHRLPELLYKLLITNERVFEMKEEPSGVIAEGQPVSRDGGSKGFLPVMYGCDNFCSYCVVPLVRGRERSRAPQEIEKEFADMLGQGYKDITLLGQNVNSYGKGMSHGVDFAALLRRLNEQPGEFRIRFMTSHPKDCTPALIAAIRDCEKVCKHIHLPFQAGSDKILKAMNRGYIKAGYLALAEEIKQNIPGISLTSDVIVGFPGESYEDFGQTISLVRQVGFSSLYTFIFSSRVGTRAAELPDPVSKEEKSRWFAELLSVQEEMSAEYTRGMIGKVHRVLCEGRAKSGRMTGRTDTNILTEFEGRETAPGEFVNVLAESAGSWTLIGIRV